jgi:hypothetical protein
MRIAYQRDADDRLIDPAYRAVAQRCCESPPHATLFARCCSLRLSPTRRCAG